MRGLFAFLLIIFSFQLYAQNVQLANEYYRNGEYEKAAEIFGQLVKSRKNAGDYYFGRYLECLISLKKYEEAKDAVKSQIKSKKGQPQYYIYRGNILEKEGDFEAAEKDYRKAIEGINPNHATISRVAATFSSYNKLEWAIEAYIKGGDLMKDETLYAYNVGDIYRRQGDNSRMIEFYLKSLRQGNRPVENLKKILARYLTEDDYLDLQQQLYIQVQEYPESMDYLELLEWVFIQKKDYKNALRQAKAIDKRQDEQGLRVYNLATVAFNARDYEAAIDAFTYIVEDLGSTSPYYFDAQKEVLTTKKEKVVRGRKFDEAELVGLRAEYTAFIEQWGYTENTAPILAEWASLESLYLGDTDKAIDLLKRLIDIPNINKFVLNNAKIDLGDAYLIKGEIWEATLLYSQVDKTFREDFLGEKARYKNARLFYFNGDFEWAQAQYDILKAATSRLISNDAIDQSVFIMDNLGLDTTPVPLQMYARAELLQFQNKYDQAFAVLDSLITEFPGHSLEDDIWYLKAQVYKKQKDFDRAINLYERVFTTYPEDIRADNALFELADLYDLYLNDKEKAMPLYEKLFIDYSGSTLAVEARKKFRLLRGDMVQ